MRYLFPMMMTSVVTLLMPAGLTISTGSNLQFLAFLAVGSMMFVGATPAFKNGGIEFKVHLTSAYCAVTFALLGVAFVSGYGIIIPLFSLIFLAIAGISKTIKKAYIYGLETIAFMSTFVSILLYYF